MHYLWSPLRFLPFNSSVCLLVDTFVDALGAALGDYRDGYYLPVALNGRLIVFSATGVFRVPYRSSFLTGGAAQDT